jgi:hypothetical protein
MYFICCLSFSCQALHQHTLKLLSQALRLLPHISVKLSAFLERLLQVRQGFGFVWGSADLLVASSCTLG